MRGFDQSIKDLIVNMLNPLIFSDKTASTQGDRTNWRQSMNGPFNDDYREVTCTEIETLEKNEA